MIMSNNFITGIYNPDVLSCIANLSSDEVFTSPELANKLLDMLPQELFSNPKTTFLDPGCKSGIFLREIAKRLIKGLEQCYPNLDQRLQHIFTEQLFGISVTELTSMLSRRTTYCSKFPNGDYSIIKFESPEGNIRYKKIKHTWKNKKCIWCGANQEQYDRDDTLETYAYEFIHTKNPENIFNRHFDVIISNPPYSLSDGGGKSGKGASPIYQYFVENSKKLNPSYILMVIPSRWFAGGKGLDEFREIMLNDERIAEIIDYSDSKDCFTSGVDIPGGICYFLWDKNHKGNCKITNILKHDETITEYRPLNEFATFIRDNRSIKIVKKILSKNETMMSDIVLSRRPFGLDSDTEFDNNGDMVLRSSKGIGSINKEKVTAGFDIINKWKTIVSKVTTEHAGVPDKDGKMKVLAVVEILEPGVVCTESYLVAGAFDTKDEAKRLEKYLKTKFVRFLMIQMLASMNMSKSTFSYVPFQNFTEEWDDAKLYNKYNLTDSEIELIENSVKPMI